MGHNSIFHSLGLIQYYGRMGCPLYVVTESKVPVPLARRLANIVLPTNPVDPSGLSASLARDPDLGLELSWTGILALAAVGILLLLYLLCPDPGLVSCGSRLNGHRMGGRDFFSCTRTAAFLEHSPVRGCSSDLFHDRFRAHVYHGAPLWRNPVLRYFRTYGRIRRLDKK